MERQNSVDTWKHRAPSKMQLNMDTSMSLARSMAGASSTRIPNPEIKRSNTSSKQCFRSFTSVRDDIGRCNSLSQEGLAYKKSTRPWAQRRSIKNVVGNVPKEMEIKRWNGAARTANEWDGLRKDPELWIHDGNCLIYLCARGQARRGPAFKVHFDALMNANCQPFLERFMIRQNISTADQFELYIPSPQVIDRDQSFRYHISTRNFLAWLMDRPLVGPHLGAALVSLLNSMDEFRSCEDNLKDILDYMDREGYLNMTNHPDHALAVLYFAEHFRLEDVWTDAFVHCVGMNEIIIHSTEFEYISRGSRALITRSRTEMDVHLERIGKSLSTFLEDELSVSNLGLSLGARAHLDRFRAFLQAYYVAKLGYYPPPATPHTTYTFPKSVLHSMVTEFRILYEYLVDNSFNPSDLSNSPTPAQGGICVLQSLQTFDEKHHHKSLEHPLPLLPLAEDMPKPSTFASRFSFRSDKMRPDSRLVTFAALSKATNARNASLLECPLVRAYRNFEKECAFTNVKSEKIERASQADARKVRWIMIYAMLQTLSSATSAPYCVHDQDSIPYNIAVHTADCIPWPQSLPYRALLRTQTDQVREEYTTSHAEPLPENSHLEIRPDIDYSISHSHSSAQTPAPLSRKDSILSTISTISSSGSPVIHPVPQRHSHHEILVHGYGNGLNTVSIISGGKPLPKSTGNSNYGSYPSADLTSIPQRDALALAVEVSNPSPPSHSPCSSLSPSPTSSVNQSHWSSSTHSDASSATSLNIDPSSRRDSLASNLPSTFSSINPPFSTFNNSHTTNALHIVPYTNKSSIKRSNSVVSLSRRSLMDFLDSARPFPRLVPPGKSISRGDEDLFPEPLRIGEGKECMRITQEIKVEYEAIVKKEGARAFG